MYTLEDMQESRLNGMKEGFRDGVLGTVFAIAFVVDRKSVV